MGEGRGEGDSAVSLGVGVGDRVVSPGVGDGVVAVASLVPGAVEGAASSPPPHATRRAATVSMATRTLCTTPSFPRA
jgi:hypothetical protein